MASNLMASETLSQRSEWYGHRAHHNCSLYILIKGMQIVCAAAIPGVAVAGPANRLVSFEGGMYDVKGVERSSRG